MSESWAQGLLAERLSVLTFLGVGWRDGGGVVLASAWAVFLLQGQTFPVSDRSVGCIYSGLHPRREFIKTEGKKGGSS